MPFFPADCGGIWSDPTFADILTITISTLKRWNKTKSRTGSSNRSKRRRNSNHLRS